MPPKAAGTPPQKNNQMCCTGSSNRENNTTSLSALSWRPTSRQVANALPYGGGLGQAAAIRSYLQWGEASGWEHGWPAPPPPARLWPQGPLSCHLKLCFKVLQMECVSGSEGSPLGSLWSGRSLEALNRYWPFPDPPTRPHVHRRGKT